tara:strand:+ start:869 stop:1069 length:201 start_codon:yes stop_codon:yes gene_type:complete
MPYNKPEHYTHGGLPRVPVNILRLISELEGSYQLLHYMGFDEDRDTIKKIKDIYYKLYFKIKKDYE